ncbi:uncharacterized protein LOC128856339 [Anastrepha ludens]|uniref:uncharacterized protein LOC128856339 n=1 Tax=Anastrepha ludens TaxID=28586 RepID=UPI0023B0867C|nr:uncharacterized protein LOC128856339 [Anastrepha ludens]
MCKHAPDKFWFICGLYILKKSARKKLTTHLLAAYEQYFGLRAKDMDKTWTPNSVCATCSARLNEFTKGSRTYLSFGKPFEWRNPIDHVSDCYFCLTKLRGGKYSKATYAEVSSVTKSAPHSTQYPKREPPTPKAEPLSSQGITASISSVGSSPSISSQKAKPINQRALSDLCRDLNLSKEKSELLASRLIIYNKRKVTDADATLPAD